ncbi:MAG: AAA family ATPase [Bacteroidales bacterium]|nr:AAA family ATPase [Bacteroidales bacterium]
MKIKSIKVEELFLQFNYTLDFEKQGDINIISGPNGFGKSTLLRMIYNLFALNFYYFFQIPFKSITYVFENDFTITIKKHKIEDSLTSNISTDVSEKSDEISSGILYVSSNKLKTLVVLQKHVIEEKISKLGYKQQDAEIWVNALGDTCFHVSDILNKQPDITEIFFKEESNFLMTLFSSNILFIKDNRLFYSSFEKTKNSTVYLPMEKPVVDRIASELKMKLSDVKKILAEKFQEAQKNIIYSITQGKIHTFTKEEYTQRVEILNTIFFKLNSFGILEKIDIPLNWNENNAKYLSITLLEYEKAIQESKEMLDKLALFQMILSKSEFVNKQILINESFGFKFVCEKENYFIPNRALSSGEQHKIIILYELIFKTSRGMMVLIDEPELSNHVIWQLSFIDEIKQVSEKLDLQFIIATHSPQIIHERWELVTDLFKINNQN